jgi:DNA modification methylase
MAKWQNRIMGQGEESPVALIKQVNPLNPRLHPERQRTALENILDTVGVITEVIVNRRTGHILDGHLRVELALAKGEESVPVKYVDLSEDEERLVIATFDPIAGMAEFDPEILEFLKVDVAETFDFDLESVFGDLDSILDSVNGHETERDVEPQIDRAAELQQEHGTELGQLWELGRHRLAVGDCTDRGAVGRVMGDGKATLLHADPPYGMGKEKDGIANDNLYRDKLDAFQMQWWDACRPLVEDNGSVYIWGNAEDLWRLWFVGGLRDSERVTFRNEIVWDKGDAGAGGISHQGAEGFRMYPNGSERCLFFMLGEQGFNNNADNYWEGWEPIRQYLYDERVKMGWDVPTMKRIVGHSDLSRDHWTSKSQWSFPTRDVYEKMKQAAKGLAFKRDYDELKRDFYATRAYFDNTHDNMTDVWKSPRVTGEERWGHATPKPVAMIERVVKSSSQEGAVVLSPFLGSGTDLVACENLGRRCRGIEIDPGYAAVTIRRWEELTGKKAVRL